LTDLNNFMQRCNWKWMWKR